MKNNKPVYAQNKGFILISVVLTLTILATLAFMLSRQSAINAGGVVREHEPDVSRYVAEAGYNHALWQLNRMNCSGYADIAATSLGNHSYTATITDSNGTALTAGSPANISTTGTHNNGTSFSLDRNAVKIYQAPTTMILQPGAELEDAFIWDGAHKFKNFGVSPILNIKNDRNVLIRFALTSLPSGARITDARLGLYLEGGAGVINGVLDLHAINRSWVEGTYDDATPPAGGGVSFELYDGTSGWNTRGGDYDAAIIDSITLPTMTPGWYEWNVTSQIHTWLDGAPDHGFLLREGGGDAGDIDFTSSDSATASNRPKLTITYACECGQTCSQEPEPTLSLLISTNDVSGTGAPGLDAWTAGEAVEVSDPNLALEPGTTDGTFSSMFNLDNFAGSNNTDIDAIHYVDTNITIGGTNSVDLLVGDLLLSTNNGETLTGSDTQSITVNDEDVFVFRPDVSDDYSAGIFIYLLDGSAFTSDQVVGLSLIEKDTEIGDVTVGQGHFLFGTVNRRDIQLLRVDDAGLGTTVANDTELIDGPSLSFGSEIRGMDLAEDEVIIGGHTIPAGSILLTLSNDDTGGVGDNLVPVDGADIFYLTVTQTGASPVADATLLFEGLDINLDTSNEHLQALTLKNETLAGGGGGTDYLDEFNAIAYNGDDGSLSWGNDWQETGESDGPGNGIVRVVSNARCSSSNCIRIGHSDIEDQPTKTLVREVDLSAATTAAFSYDYEAQNMDNNGSILVRVSADGGSNWTTLATYTPGSGSGSESFDISAYIAVNTQIRVEVTGKYSMYLYVDNVSIVISGGGSPPPPPSDCNGNFHDQFNTRTFDGDDGGLSWSGAWQEVGESNGADSGDIRVMTDINNYQLRTRDNDNGGEGVEREADLTGAISATLSYDYRRMNLDNSSDYTVVEISDNGAAGPWTELTRHQGSGNDGSYQSASHDISAFISANTRIRFKTSSNMGGTDTVWFDNIQIQCSP